MLLVLYAVKHDLTFKFIVICFLYWINSHSTIVVQLIMGVLAFGVNFLDQFPNTDNF